MNSQSLKYQPSSYRTIIVLVFFNPAEPDIRKDYNKISIFVYFPFLERCPLLGWKKEEEIYFFSQGNKSKKSVSVFWYDNDSGQYGSFSMILSHMGISGWWGWQMEFAKSLTLDSSHFHCSNYSTQRRDITIKFVQILTNFPLHKPIETIVNSRI